MKNKLEVFHTAFNTGKPFVLATVVDCCGSVPQKPGARQAIFVDGSSLGTVGGGCVEGKVIKRAIAIISKQIRDAEICNLPLTDEVGTKDGDVCGGTIDILLEPIFPSM